jgi:hypothetical protein
MNLHAPAASSICRLATTSIALAWCAATQPVALAELAPDRIVSPLRAATDAVQRRESAMTSGRFRIRAVGRQSAPSADADSQGGAPKPSNDAPQEDGNCKITREINLVFRGVRWRLSDEGDFLEHGAGRIVSGKHVEAWDGDIHTSFLAAGPGSKLGAIRRGPSRIGSYSEVLPVTLAFRPEAWRGIRFNPENSGVDVVIYDQERCLLVNVTQDIRNRRIVKKYWLGIDKDHNVLRFESQSLACDIDYRKDAKHGWAPSQWRLTFSGVLRGPHDEWTYEVLDYELNVPIPDDAFEVDFPVGTLVQDAIEDRRYRIGGDKGR